MLSKKLCSTIVYLCTSAVVFLTVGILIFSLWELVYNAIVKGNLLLKPDSAAYKVWVKNPVPLTLKLYVFNWTNPEDVRDNSTKPRFQEMGSYTYGETKEKVDLIWNVNNTVTFKHLKKWYFDGDRSGGSLEDNVTSVNPVALSAAYSSRTWSYVGRKTMSLSLSTMVDTIYITETVRKVLFDGYDDPIMKVANSLPLVSANFPPMDKFGWFYGRNGSEDYEGSFNMDTGVSGQLGELYTWKYASHTPYFPGKCGALKGASAGEFFPTNLKKDSIIKFFSADLCRYVELEFEKEEIVSGIVGYKYSAGAKFLDNGTKIPENRCFCDGDCMPSGAMNVSACRYGSPAFVSLPHFYKADPYYLDSIEGLKPDPEKHDFFMVFEPKTGVPLKVAARLQLNLRLQSVDGVRLFSNVPTVYMPVLWFEQVVTVPEDMIFGIKLLINFKIICWAISFTCIAVAVLIGICMFYKLCSKSAPERKKPRHISKEERPLNIKKEEF